MAARTRTESEAMTEMRRLRPAPEATISSNEGAASLVRSFAPVGGGVRPICELERPELIASTTVGIVLLCPEHGLAWLLLRLRQPRRPARAISGRC